jgi:hypothetical protein
LAAARALHKAEIPTLAPGAAGFVKTASGQWVLGEEFTAFVVARDISEAREHLGRVGADVEVLDAEEPVAATER